MESTTSNNDSLAESPFLYGNPCQIRFWLMIWFMIFMRMEYKGTGLISNPDSKVHRANMEPIWGRQNPGVPKVGPMNFDLGYPSVHWFLFSPLTSNPCFRSTRHKGDLLEHSALHGRWLRKTMVEMWPWVIRKVFANRFTLSVRKRQH